MADLVDMDEQGRVLDSLRRVKLMLFKKLTKGSPCRVPGGYTQTKPVHVRERLH
jgi:hypothetical protein